jgi:hypothetical protein
MSALAVRPARESDADTMAATKIAVLRLCRRLGERTVAWSVARDNDNSVVAEKIG